MTKIQEQALESDVDGISSRSHFLSFFWWHYILQRLLLVEYLGQTSLA
jgi:hypothetical protein